MRRLRILAEENRKLKQLVADLSLDKKMLQDVLSKNCEARGAACSCAAGAGVSPIIGTEDGARRKRSPSSRFGSNTICQGRSTKSLCSETALARRIGISAGEAGESFCQERSQSLWRLGLLQSRQY